MRVNITWHTTPSSPDVCLLNVIIYMSYIWRETPHASKYKSIFIMTKLLVGKCLVNRRRLHFHWHNEKQKGCGVYTETIYCGIKIVHIAVKM